MKNSSGSWMPRISSVDEHLRVGEDVADVADERPPIDLPVIERRSAPSTPKTSSAEPQQQPELAAPEPQAPARTIVVVEQRLAVGAVEARRAG